MDLLADVFGLIWDLLPDREKKIYLSTCVTLRSTLGQHSFHQRVDRRHLVVCPYPEKHSNILVGPHANQENYVSPAHITKMTIDWFDPDVMLVLSGSTRLKELSLSCSERQLRLLTVPDSVEHLSLPQHYFSRLVRTALGSAKMSLGYTTLAGWGSVERFFPASLKTLTAKDTDGNLLRASIPYSSETLTMEFI